VWLAAGVVSSINFPYSKHSDGIHPFKNASIVSWSTSSGSAFADAEHCPCLFARRRQVWRCLPLLPPTTIDSSEGVNTSLLPWHCQTWQSAVPNVDSKPYFLFCNLACLIFGEVIKSFITRSAGQLHRPFMEFLNWFFAPATQNVTSSKLRTSQKISPSMSSGMWSCLMQTVTTYDYRRWHLPECCQAWWGFHWHQEEVNPLFLDWLIYSMHVFLNTYTM
jgi:hypothetical protein